MASTTRSRFPRRRALLKATLASLGALSLHGTAFALGRPRDKPLPYRIGRRLILVELAGANDGLNTLVPWRHERYRALRPTLALGARERIEIAPEHALHRALAPLMRRWERGELAWVHGLGYPRPNRSHFASIALWERAGDGRDGGDAGWLTHDVEHRLGALAADAHGISLADDLGPFASDTGRWLTLGSVDGLRQRLSTLESARQDRRAAIVPERLRRHYAVRDEMLRRLGMRLGAAPDVPELPGETLGHQLRQVHRLVRAGVEAPVFRVRLDGFDTHEAQAGTHAARLALLADALAAFADALEADGEWTNTLIMSYSEFGRRAAENGSQGTDHGTAAAHLLLGGGVAGGLYGKQPDLGALMNDDLVHTMDYRALYERSLSDWFAIDDNRLHGWRDARLDSLLRRA